MNNGSVQFLQRLWNDRSVLRDESLEDSSTLPDPDTVARRIGEDFQPALEQFNLIVDDLTHATNAHP